MKPNIYFITTENCNMGCKHCYLSAGPGKEYTTIKREYFRKVIDHLPKIHSDLSLSGGEVFTIKDTLYDFLDYIKFENKERSRKNQGKLDLWLQTNAFWATDDETTNKILSELKSFGIEGLAISSDDTWHREQGLKKENIQNVLKLWSKHGFSEKNITVIGAPYKKKKIFPLGRAKNFVKPNQLVLNYTMDCRGFLNNYNLTIDQKGHVFSCCWKGFRLKGNVINEPLTKIVERSRKDPKIVALNRGGIEERAQKDEWDEDYVSYLVFIHGSCGFCYRAYKENMK